MNTAAKATDDIRKIQHLRGTPGILVLSGRSKVLYINQRGWELIHQFDQAKVVETSGGILPCVVNDVFEDLQAIVRKQLAGAEVALTEVRRIGAATPHPILVRGLVMPGRDGLQSTILILLEIFGRKMNRALDVKERFRFTKREEMVLQNLAKGRSNKEIGSELNLAEQTVKVYIRQIMDKTKSTTRTGVLAQVLGP